MEWNCCWSVTPFLFESSGDSEEVKSDVHHDHDHEEHEVVMDESEGVSFRFDDEGDVDDDDAQSCSYDHSSYINTRYGDSQNDHLSQRLIIYDDEDGNIDDDDGNIDFDDKNMKIINPSKQQKRSHNFCVDSLEQREVDRKFWEACLAT
ncbi:hypothetical protein L1987_03736 [Smallanthus sonchifolius]|uniref:Uncharacterized protein n=1 Tax=Smallanthus sonchifolius TaxID=185202 RepID=A0ACB9KBH8_9ASTR|nr:hypothetical protein L1987_03736 [Smallanthus sonchifolius]